MKMIKNIMLLLLGFALGVLFHHAKYLRQHEVDLAKEYEQSQAEIATPTVNFEIIATPAPAKIKVHTKTCPFKCPNVH